jgi:hypothetical protein
MAPGIYTVGNATSDFPDLNAAVAALNCGGIAGPVTFLLDGPNNLHTTQLALGNINGASSTNTITFDGQGDTIRSAGSTGSSSVVWLNGSKHVRIQNMVIQGASVGVFMQNVEDIQIASNTILIDLSLTAATRGCIISSGATANLTTATPTNNILIIANQLIGGYYGIRLNGSSNSKAEDVLILTNTIRDFYFYGIYSLEAANWLVEDNTISRPTRTSVSTFYGIYNATGARDVNLSKNRIHTTHGPGASSTAYATYGIYYTGAAGDSIAPNVVSNNMLYNFNSLTGAIYGTYVTGGSYVQVYHNASVFDEAASTAGLVYANYFLGTGTNHAFKNNMTVVSRGGTGAKYCLNITGACNIPASDRNVLTMLSTGGTTNNVGYFATGFPTLANWQTANGGTFDQGSVSIDPAFVNAAAFDFTPSAFQVNNIGENLSAVVPTDFFGILRPVTPDPGAIEFSSAAQDAGIGNVSIVLNEVPTAIPNGCLASLSNPLRIEVANAGTDTLASINVSYRLNSQRVVTETVPGPFAPGSVVNHLFAAPQVLTNGIDTLRTWVNIANDGNTANDSVFLVVNNYQTSAILRRLQQRYFAVRCLYQSRPRCKD